jgi:uncharacterized protein (DUF1697 family)
LRYAVLLRAINAGKDSRITMRALRMCVEEAGITVLGSYLPSGNLVIEAPRTNSAQLAERIGQAVGQRLGRPTPAIVLSRAQLDRVLRNTPAQWRDEPGRAHQIIFFTQSVTAAQLLSGTGWDPDLEQLTPGAGCIYWSIRADAAQRSALGPISRSPNYQHLTVRTLHTLERLQLMLGQPMPSR